MKLLVLLLGIMTSAVIASEDDHHRGLLSRVFFNYINSFQNTWKAGMNFISDLLIKKLKHFASVYLASEERTLQVREYLFGENEVLPTEFDSRKHWSRCPIISEIVDQGNTGFCWAAAAVTTMSDRECIHANVSFHYSIDDLVSCCRECVSDQGGIALHAWSYWTREGIVSGGPYNSSEGCRPFETHPCDHYGRKNGTFPPCTTDPGTIPKCKRTCGRHYNITYKKDKHYGECFYAVSGEKHIQKEIMLYGPVEAHFEIYTDFLYYKSGVYKNVYGKKRFGHSARMIGWGVENGTPYWLLANSWNNEWGENGLFKFLRGKNECGIEDYVFAGMPRV